MNDADNKKLEEIKEWWKLRANPDDATYWAVTWLLFKAEEQDREIERLNGIALELNERLENSCMRCGKAEARVKEQDREIAELDEGQDTALANLNEALARIRELEELAEVKEKG